MPQTKLILQCRDCDAQNYVTSKNRQNVTGTLTLKKFCSKCRKHTVHRETRLRR